MKKHSFSTTKCQGQSIDSSSELKVTSDIYLKTGLAWLLEVTAQTILSIFLWVICWREPSSSHIFFIFLRLRWAIMPDINLILILESFLDWSSHQENNDKAQYYGLFSIFGVLINGINSVWITARHRLQRKCEKYMENNQFFIYRPIKSPTWRLPKLFLSLFLHYHLVYQGCVLLMSYLASAFGNDKQTSNCIQAMDQDQFIQQIRLQKTAMYAQCLSPYTPMSSKQAIKKDYFIQSRTDSIQKHYKFYPKPIGKGAYGTVYQAKMMRPPFADRVVKVIQKRLVRNPDSLKNEYMILKKLDHPNIVKLYQTYEDESYLYLVQDLCEGGELFDRLDAVGKLPEEQAKKIFRQMVKIVKYLHLQKICHRDLKAENFLFSGKDNDHIVLIDFGLSYQWENNMQEELIIYGANKILGTAYYIAPEVLQKRYDERCDIWSLGALLHIITTATAPFMGDGDMEIIENVKKNNYNRNSEFDKLSSPLQDLLGRILQPKDQRITLDEILAHPWMQEASTLQNKSLLLDFAKMKSFSSCSKLKVVSLAFIAAQLPAKQIQELGQLFKQVNTLNNGFLSVSEVQAALKSQGIHLSYNELHRILKVMDMDKNGKINFNQFVASCMDSQYYCRKDYIDYIFSHFDRDGNGKISRAELYDQIEKMGLELPGRLVNEIMKEADKDQDGFISYHEFIETFKSD